MILASTTRALPQHFANPASAGVVISYPFWFAIPAPAAPAPFAKPTPLGRINIPVICLQRLIAAPQHIFLRNCEGTFELIAQGEGYFDEVRNESIGRISAPRRRVRTRGELQARKRKGHMEPDGCAMARMRKTDRRCIRGRAIPNRSGQIEAS
jgi:hypothetical protein